MTPTEGHTTAADGTVAAGKFCIVHALSVLKEAQAYVRSNQSSPSLAREFDQVHDAVAALMARNADLEVGIASINSSLCEINASVSALIIERDDLRETLEIVKANAAKSAPLPGFPALGVQWIIGFSTDNGQLSFDEVFSAAITAARTSTAGAGQS